MSGRLSTSLAAGVILIGHWIIVPVLVTLPNYYSRFLRSKVASHAKPSMARVKGPSLHPTYMAESPGCESSQSGLRDGTFPLSFLFPSFASPGGVQGWKANNQRCQFCPRGPLPHLGLPASPGPKEANPNPRRGGHFNSRLQACCLCIPKMRCVLNLKHKW